MDLANFDTKTVDAALNRQGYIIIKDKGLKKKCEAARKEYEVCLKTLKVHAPSDKFDSRQLSRKPWRKLTIGGRNGNGDPIAPNLQKVYFDPSDKSHPSLGSLVHSMIVLRKAPMAAGPHHCHHREHH